jgi:formylglycine-generating enzyme required for sulfatase activity
MSGNVWEWCEDVVLAFYRRVRGGSWAYEGEYCAIASRADNYYDPVYRGRNIGFRLARNAP